MTPPPQFPALPPLASDTTTPRDAANDNNLLDFYNPDHAAAPKSIMHSENRNLIMSSASNRNSDRNSNKNSIGSSSTDNNSEAEEAVSKRPLPHPPTQSPPRGAGLRGKVCDSNNNINIDTDRNNGGSSISTSSTRQVEDSESEDDRARFRNRNQESAEEEEVSSIEDEQEGEQDEQGVSNITTILQQGERRQRRQRQRQEREDRARQNKLDRATARQLKYFDHMMVNLDVLVFAELAVLYYMECSFFRFLLRAFLHHIFLSPSPVRLAHEPAPAAVLGSVLFPNLVCVTLHTAAALPRATSSSRGYLHGGLFVDFIGQKVPSSRLPLLCLDAAVFALQLLMMILKMRRDEMGLGGGNGSSTLPATSASSLVSIEEAMRRIEEARPPTPTEPPSSVEAERLEDSLRSGIAVLTEIDVSASVRRARWQAEVVSGTGDEGIDDNVSGGTGSSSNIHRGRPAAVGLSFARHLLAAMAEERRRRMEGGRRLGATPANTV